MVLQAQNAGDVMDFLLLGNHPFLDFINTKPVVGGEALELIGDGGAFFNLIGRLDLTKRPEVRRPLEREAQETASLAREIREDFRALLFANRDSKLDASELLQANQWFARLGSPQVILRDGEPSLSYRPFEAEPLAPELRALIESGLELFTSDSFSKVRKCANPDCGLWYLDTTKSRTRRWCSMNMCGNVEKARAFRQRHKTE